MIVIGVIEVVGTVQAATTISTNILTEGTITSSATSTASAFVASSSTATSTVAGNFTVAGNASTSALTVSGKINGVKVYRALLTQTSTAAPVATVLENSLGGMVVWTRTDTGDYLGTLVGAFTASKTFVHGYHFVQTSSGLTGLSSIVRTGTNTIQVLSTDEGNQSDGMLQSSPVEILVYP